MVAWLFWIGAAGVLGVAESTDGRRTAEDGAKDGTDGIAVPSQACYYQG
jgi:hypothetical protein